MKTLIRHGVFETNSSSCHSLSLQTNKNGEVETNPNFFNDYEIDDDGVLSFDTVEFGWEANYLGYFQDKLSYVMTYCITTSRYDDFMFVLKVLHDVTQFKSLKYERFNILLGTWNDEEDLFEFADDLDIYEFFKRVEDETYSYIDGQSIDLLNDIIKLRDEHKLKNLLFCRQSYIKTDNDNH